MMPAAHGVNAHMDGMDVLAKPGIWAKAEVGAGCAGLLLVRMRWHQGARVCSDLAGSPIPNVMYWGVSAENYCWTTVSDADLAIVAAVAAATGAGRARKAKKRWIQMQPL